MDTIRKEAMAWFHDFDDDDKMDLCIYYDDILKLNGVGPKSITGRQIQQIYEIEMTAKNKLDKEIDLESLKREKKLNHMSLTREEMVHLIFKKSKSTDTLLILAISETDFVEKIYCGLYNIK